jgi:hypothetical protein
MSKSAAMLDDTIVLPNMLSNTSNIYHNYRSIISANNMVKGLEAMHKKIRFTLLGKR